MVAHTIAGGKGRKRQLHSARRQTTLPSGISQLIDVELILQIDGPCVPGPITCLQGTGPAASEPRTRTWSECVYVSKVVCNALAVAGVTRRPCGLFQALTQESGMCATHDIPTQSVYI